MYRCGVKLARTATCVVFPAVLTSSRTIQSASYSLTEALRYEPLIYSQENVFFSHLEVPKKTWICRRTNKEHVSMFAEAKVNVFLPSQACF